MSQFEIGDVVQLKSGGPKMTIQALYNAENASWYGIDGEAAFCFWFDANDKKDERFAIASLASADPESS